jgi:hypothetical protein
MVANKAGVSTPFRGSGIFFSFMATDILVSPIAFRFFSAAAIGRRCHHLCTGRTKEIEFDITMICRYLQHQRSLDSVDGFSSSTKNGRRQRRKAVEN